MMHLPPPPGHIIAPLWTLLALSACTHGPEHPAFQSDRDHAQQLLQHMATDPVELERPVLVLGGILDPGIAAEYLATSLREATGDDRVHAITFFFDRSFDAMRQRVLEHAHQHFADPQGNLPEFDIIAVSMGGLVARHTAIEQNGRALPINRLFTLATPHRGADMADLPTLDPRRHDMRAGSELLQKLDRAIEHADYSLYAYVRLGDQMVGASNAAPPDHDLYWLPNRPGELAHAMIYRDPRIHADIFRRLRSEPPLFDRPLPLPDD